MKKFFGILKNVTFDLIRIKILILLEYNLVMNINNNKIFSTIQLLYSAQSCIYTYTSYISNLKKHKKATNIQKT